VDYDCVVPVFVCPRCAYRERGTDRYVRHQPRGCARCGFGFSFEMLEDFYAGPRCALVVADAERRVLVAGHATFPVTGYQEPELLGRDIADALGLGFDDGDDPIATSLEWGVRRLGVDCTYRPKGAGAPVACSIDVFPAYDDDGGLMVALTPFGRE
jgi:hypothetical protein